MCVCERMCFEDIQLYECVDVCVGPCTCTWECVYNCLHSPGSSLCSAWFHWAGRYTDRQGGRGSFLITSPSFLFLFWQSFALVWRPTSPFRPAYLFRAPEARLLMHLRLSLAASPPRPELQTPVTVQDAHFVSRVCPKIVSICIFGNGDVCLINLCVRGIQRQL